MSDMAGLGASPRPAMRPVLEEIGYVPGPYRLVAVAWLSFLMAGLATMVFFAAIDPLELQPCLNFPEVSRTAAYTIGFLLFWLLTAASSLVSLFFLYPRRAVPPVDPSLAIPNE